MFIYATTVLVNVITFVMRAVRLVVYKDFVVGTIIGTTSAYPACHRCAPCALKTDFVSFIPFYTINNSEAYS